MKTFSKELQKKLESLRNISRVADDILTQKFIIDESDADFIGMSRTCPGNWSYINQDRLKRVGKFFRWQNKSRYHTSPMRLINKISIVTYSEKEIDNFMFLWNSLFSNSKTKYKFLTGPDIAKYYDESNYYTCSGTLGASCMRNVDPSYFEIYTANPGVVSMLCGFLEGKIVSRCIVWNYEDKKLHDRVYAINSLEETSLISECIRQGLLQISEKNNVKNEGNLCDKEIRIQLDKFEFDYYPYLDTFQFMTYSGLLLNKPSSINEVVYSFTDTSGSYDAYCPWCGEDCDTDYIGDHSCGCEHPEEED